MPSYTGYRQNGIPFDDLYVKYNIFTQGGLWAAGYNSTGELGDNSISHRSSPVQTITGGTNWKLVAAFGSVSAIKTDGSLWLWGSNTYGQLGENLKTPAHRSSPVQTVSGGNNWVLVASGGYHTAAIKTDGTLWTWGYNTTGTLGDNSVTHRSSPVQTVASSATYKRASCGQYHTAAIKTDGTLWTWGNNSNGQLGNNSLAHRSSPVQTAAAGTNWKLVSGGYYHTAAIKTDGTLWTWGHNSYGDLGDGSTINKSSPVQTIATGTNWKHVSGCGYHTSAIKTDSTLWLWGSNQYGELGDNSISNKSSPVQTISTGANWKQVTGATYMTACVKTDGTLWTWGSNTFFSLGDNSQINRSSPVQTAATGTNWKQVTCQQYGIAAIRDSW